MKDVRATREAFSPPKRTSSTSKHEISSVSIFMGHFCPVGSESAFPVRSRIQLAKMDPDPQPGENMEKMLAISSKVECLTKIVLTESELVNV